MRGLRSKILFGFGGLLLILVAGLSTLAKNGQYFPKTTPAHNVSISTKMI